MDIETILEEANMGKKISKLENKIDKLEEKNNKFIPKNDKQKQHKKEIEDVILIIRNDITYLKKLYVEGSDESKKQIKAILSDRKKLIKMFSKSGISDYVKMIGVPLLVGSIFGGISYLFNTHSLNSGEGQFIVPKAMRFTDIEKFTPEEMKGFINKAAAVNGGIPLILSSALMTTKHFNNKRNKKETKKVVSKVADNYRKYFEY